ncbi:hypothetical protein SprV_0100228400 [Sparganum proliferum]
MITLKGVTNTRDKGSRRRMANFLFVSAGPKSSAGMPNINARAVCTWNAVKRHLPQKTTCTTAIREDVRADIRQRKRHRNLTVDEEKGLRSLKADDSIVVVPADKEGATVIMDKVDYVQKANTVFNDREAYAPLAEDPTKKQAAAIKKKVNELARLKLINPNDSKFMTLSDPRIAHAYGLPKVHKPDAPLRIIVPLIGSPTYSLTKWLYRHLKHLADGSQYSIKDSQAFLEKIQGLKVSPDESILSSDVVALFSSIPHDPRDPTPTGQSHRHSDTPLGTLVTIASTAMSTWTLTTKVCVHVSPACAHPKTPAANPCSAM